MDLRGANVSHAHLSRSNLFCANLGTADLSNADLTGANVGRANLSRANLTCASLIDADFSDAKLDGANFRDAKLDGANFRDAKLAGADLSGANLKGVKFYRTNLRDAKLDGANLRDANFVATHLSGTEFRGALILNTRFANCDLSDAKGLDLTRDTGPSTVGIDTIFRSKGQIPENFLRGCGVPESFITQMRSLVGAEDGIQFYSCFISYSAKDEDFAKRLHGKMRDARLRVWFAPEEMKGGNLLIEQIETAIRVYDKLLIVLSKASLKSEWVMTELRRARKAERVSGKRKLFPVRLVDFETLRDWECFDADSGKDLAVELREYFIPDFSNWKDHDQFEAAFERLLKDLRADERAK